MPILTTSVMGLPENPFQFPEIKEFFRAMFCLLAVLIYLCVQRQG